MSRRLLVPVLVLASLGVTGGVAVARPRDRDKDGLPDRWERRHHISTKQRSAKRDPDHDRLKNRGEYRWHTNPRRADSDRDGLKDGAEVHRYHTHPRKWDTDGDGYSDGDEVRSGSDPLRRRSKPKRPAPAPSPGGPVPDDPPIPCTVTVGSVAAAQSAVQSAPVGQKICLANGSYGRINLNASKAGGLVELSAQTPGQVTVSGIQVHGQGVRISRLRVIGGSITMAPGTSRVVIERNYFSGGYFGVEMASSDAYISEVTVRGNRFQGPFGEDAIRANRYHDADGDGVGLLVEGNEFSGVIESGNHADCLQSVAGGDHVVFRRNYLHDNLCEGLFFKDHPSTIDGLVVEDNLALRNDAPAPVSGVPSVMVFYRPITNLVFRRNTVWTPDGLSPVRFSGSPWDGRADVTGNVIFQLYSDGGGFSNWHESDNTVCRWSGSLPARSASDTVSCSPAFAAPASDDYRIAGSARGVDWRPADQHYGP